MRITRIETVVVEVPIRRELMIRSALGTHDRSRYALVRLETDGGHVGAGEATVTPRWSGETAAGAAHLIDEHLGPAVLGSDPRDVEGLLEALDGAAFGNPFAKAAVEMAAWDAWGRAEGKPVYELLGGAARDLALPIRFSLGAGSPEATAALARQRVAWGHRTVKVKVGLDPQADVERVRAVRAAIGPSVALTVDANGGWSVDDAIAALHEMADQNLLLAEQPTPREDVDALARVRSRSPIDVMADESVFTLYDARRVLGSRAADILAIYPGKNGGILRAWQIAALAAERGVPCAIGSNLETDLATAAMCHLSVAAPNVAAERYHGDILGPLYHEGRITREPVRMEAGFAHCPTGPGLGVEVDWDEVRRRAVSGG